MNARSIAILSAVMGLWASGARADVDVVVSIKPIHSLVAAVMEGAGTPRLLLEGASSPHTYAMRPSEARAIANADVVFWVGDSLESFLANAIDSLAPEAEVVELIDTPSLTLLKVREGGAFDAHDHGHGHGAHGDHEADHAEAHEDHEDGHADHAAHDHDDDEGHEDGHAEHAADAHEGEADGHDDHAHNDPHHGHSEHHNEFDPHIWLDPRNAQAMVAHIASVLEAADPDNAALYAANAERRIGEIDTLTAELNETLSPVRDRSFVVFHDAYHYLEVRFGVDAVGSITISPEIMPGASQLAEIRERIETLGPTCVFAEPQFTPKLVDVVVEGTEARTGVLDPLGAEIPAGIDQYDALMRTNVEAMRSCLLPQS